MADMRMDPISGKWSLIASGRSARPKNHSFEPATPEDAGENCPFCPGHEEETPPEIDAHPKSGLGWQVRVVPNKYPAISPDPLLNEKADRLFRAMSGGGRHEVIIDSPDHKKSLADFPEVHAADVLTMLQRRVRAMYEMTSVRSIAPFKNHGKVAGASLEHSHLQVIGMPALPPHTEIARRNSEAFYRETGKPLLEKTIEWELEQEKRIVETGKKGAITYCPFASRFPFQTEITPWPAQNSFVESSSEVVAAIGSALVRSLRRIKRLLNDPPLNVFFHIETRLEPGEHDEAHRWRVEIVPRLTVMAGLEIGAGMHINEVAPEEAAGKLRETRI